MDEYISKGAMLKNLTADLEHHSGGGDPRTHLIMRRFIKYVKDFPAADVQPVVCCKDCIERPHCQTHSDDFYCAFGERSDSND